MLNSLTKNTASISRNGGPKEDAVQRHIRSQFAHWTIPHRSAQTELIAKVQDLVKALMLDAPLLYDT